MIARRIVVTGRVQGVGYRETMVALARSAGVSGWVRNLRDGTVEAVVQGDAAAVERLVAWCGEGPPAARVLRIDVSDASTEPEHRGFVRRPSA